jgi:hypothetical protein
MSRLRIAVIVEGDGEVQAIRPLLTRIWTELLGGDYLEIPSPPGRVSRSKLIPYNKPINKSELQRAVALAAAKLRGGQPSDPVMILILLDSDLMPPCELAPQLLAAAREKLSNIDIACVLAHKEYETWFVAAADSLRDYLDFDVAPSEPEKAKSGKKWIEDRFHGAKYSETVDQPSMSVRMDLSLCRKHSPSFDKLCRELEKKLKKNHANAPSHKLAP